MNNNVNMSQEEEKKTKKRHSLAQSISIVKDRLFEVSARLSILFAACILTIHGAFLTWGSALVWHSDAVWTLAFLVGVMDLMLLVRICRPAKAKDWWYHPMVIHMAVAITATWLILVGMYIDPVKPDKDSTFLNLTANTSDAELQNKLQDLRNSDAQQSVNVLVDSIGNIGLSINFTGDIQFDTLAYIGIQLVTPVIIFTRWLMPRIDLTTEQLSQLLVAGVAMSFDIVELQDNIQNEDLRNTETLAYLILFFTSLSLLQLLQLSEALAGRVVSSWRWEMFWTVYAVVCQEIPFLIIRIYIMYLSGFEVIQLIFPLKNAFSIVFGVYRIFAVKKTVKQEKTANQKRLSSALEEETLYRKSASNHRLSSALEKSTLDKKSASDCETATDTMKSTDWSLLEEESSLWSKRKIFSSLVLPILFLMAHLMLLIWRVTVVNDNLLFWLLSLMSAILFSAITIPKIIQHQRGISSKEMKVSIWYQPLLVYLITAIICFWLIILTLVDQNKFLSTASLPDIQQVKTECNRTMFKHEGDRQQLLISSESLPSSPSARQLVTIVPTVSLSIASSSVLVLSQVKALTSHGNGNGVASSSSSAVFGSSSKASPSSIPRPSPVAGNRTKRSLEMMSPTMPTDNTSKTASTAQAVRFIAEAQCETDASDPELLDEVSYALLQLVLPLAVFGRWWMPKEGLTSKAFSGLLQVAIAMAFDIAEFTHLIVEEPDLHNDRTLAILVLLFTSTSVLLLVQIDVGMSSDNKWSEVIWTLLTVLFLDGPFFGIRLYIASEFSAEDLQLVFLLKNLFGIIFGGYRVVSLCTAEDEKSEGDEDGTVDVTDDDDVFLRQVSSQQHVDTVRLPENYVFEMYINKTAVNDSNKEETGNSGNEVLDDEDLPDEDAVVILNEAVISSDDEVTFDFQMNEDRHEVSDQKNDQEIQPEEDEANGTVPGEEETDENEDKETLSTQNNHQI